MECPGCLCKQLQLLLALQWSSLFLSVAAPLYGCTPSFLVHELVHHNSSYTENLGVQPHCIQPRASPNECNSLTLMNTNVL